jgi:hypothetical protein
MFLERGIYFATGLRQRYAVRARTEEMPQEISHNPHRNDALQVMLFRCSRADFLGAPFV